MLLFCPLQLIFETLLLLVFSCLGGRASKAICC